MKFNPEDIEALIIAELTSTISPEERQHLYAIMEMNGQIRQQFEEIKMLWNLHSMPKAMGKMDERINLQELMAAGPKKGSKYRQLTIVSLSLASILILILSFSKTWFNKVPPVIPPNNSSEISLKLNNGQVINIDNKDTSFQLAEIALNNKNHTFSYSTHSAAGKGVLNIPAGRTYSMVLSDGTTIQLNSATRIEFLFSMEKKREIWIDGEVFINVASKPDQPFIVHTPNSIIEVLGTSFNVNTYDSQQKISLVSGKVKVITNTDSTTLQPGQEATLNNNTVQLHPFDKSETLSWMNGIYIFHNSTMQDVAKVINRWYNVTVKVDSGLLGKHFYGVIDKNKPLQIFLDNLALTNEIHYKTSNGIIKIF